MPTSISQLKTPKKSTCVKNISFFFLGIDDMFVIMQSLDNLKSDEKKDNNIPQNIGQTMTHAGVAITVTSITDIVVFAVGSSTVRIKLQSTQYY